MFEFMVNRSLYSALLLAERKPGDKDTHIAMKICMSRVVAHCCLTLHCYPRKAADVD